MPHTTEITKIQVDPQILTEIEEEAQVIVHCSFYNDPNQYVGEMGVRVWKDTFLIDEATGIKVPMIKALGIVYQPDWYFLASGETKRFTLIFEALPKSCISFTLAEIINQPGAFIVTGILRNNSDVYNARLD
ncbi:MAG: hypothetical protein QMC70_11010 [Bacteroidia bacterium]